MKTKGRLVILYLFSFIASIAPLVVAIVINRGEYIKAPSDAVKLSFGCLIALFFIFLKVLGRLSMPRAIVLYGIIFVMSYLFDALLDDLILLSGMALLGEFIDYIIFRPLIRRIKSNAMIDKTADATSTRVEEILKKYTGVK